MSQNVNFPAPMLGREQGSLSWLTAMCLWWLLVTVSFVGLPQITAWWPREETCALLRNQQRPIPEGIGVLRWPLAYFCAQGAQGAPISSDL